MSGALVAVRRLRRRAGRAPSKNRRAPPIGVVDLHVDIPCKVPFKKRSPALTEGHARL